MTLLVIHINPQEYINVETFLMENNLEYKVYQNLWEGYFEVIAETAFENVLNTNGDVYMSQKDKESVIKNTVKRLNEDEGSFLYLLFKAEELVEKKLKIREE